MGEAPLGVCEAPDEHALGGVQQQFAVRRAGGAVGAFAGVGGEVVEQRGHPRDLPEQIGVVPGLLGHAALATAERYYIHADSVKALRRFQKHVLELRHTKTIDGEAHPGAMLGTSRAGTDSAGFADNFEEQPHARGNLRPLFDG